MKRLFILYTILLYSFICYSQNYKYIGVESGLGSRKVYFIQKDNVGYMWLLTHEGIDRYDGKEFKHYTLTSEGRELSSQQDLNWLHLDKKGGLWEIGKKGKVFKYNTLHDSFEVEYQIPAINTYKEPAPVTFSFIDNDNYIWLCEKETIHLYNVDNGSTSNLVNNLDNPITYVIQYSPSHYFVGTDERIYHTELEGDSFKIIPTPALDKLSLQVNELYFDAATKQLFISSSRKGLYIFNLNTGECTKSYSNTKSSITRIKPLNDDELLIATDGAGILKLDLYTHKIVPYISVDYNQLNRMSGNTINDIYVDEKDRIWIANYPIGITIRDDRYSQFQWIKHVVGNPQSIINDDINDIFEDSEGDLWYATNNGVSLYDQKTKKWTAFLSDLNTSPQEDNHAYLSICESSPGVILTAGRNSTIYKINKRTSAVSALPLDSYSKNEQLRPDKYIRAITKDMQGNIWIGGYYNLKRLDEKNKEVKLYPDLSDITTILEKDELYMWIGSTKGLFQLNKKTGQATKIVTPAESNYIYSLCQTQEGKLYIGTNGSGLLTYNPENKSFMHFHHDNSALLSNNIYAILSDGDTDIVFSSESCLTRYYLKEKEIHNWTREQGLTVSHFNPNAAILSSNGNFIFGSSDGAIEFDKTMQLPRDYVPKIVLNDFRLFYQSVYPGDPNSPLVSSIDDTKVLELDYDQNIFSMQISSINYDYPSNILYSWKLTGFYDVWSKPGSENIIRFTNLSPGEYVLHFRTMSNENRQVLEERSMVIIIHPPFWSSIWFLLLYIAGFGLIGFALFRSIYMRKQRKIAFEKFQFFVNTAHDIRTPLTLIKAPLEEIKEKEELTESGLRNMSTAIRNVNVLLRLTTNLINFERMDLYSSELYIAKYELSSFMNEIVQSFNSYAEVRNITYKYDSDFGFLNVWFDKEKMDSVVKNIISNALKYTRDGGTVRVHTSETNNTWSIEVSDTGIGIPSGEQKKIFKTHFRASNTINSKVSGSGIGMVLVGRLVELHKGKISLNSVEHKGTTIKVTLLKGYSHYKKAHMIAPMKDTISPLLPNNYDNDAPTFINKANRMATASSEYRILVVEDNDELRSYMEQTLQDEYNVQTCENGKEALIIVKEYKPDLVISDIMMPEMQGDELCMILKNDIETSHIPVVLLTALNDERNVMRGLQVGADEYIIKPFNIGILKATLANLLTNRALLRSKYAKLEIEATQEEACNNCSTGIDWEFIASLKAHVEKHMADPKFNIDMIAGLMNMSRTSLYSKVKALTDLAPGDYIRLIRLTRAAELLKEGKYNITEVSEMTGFNDAKYFREVFKKQYKMSPSKYKGE